MNKKFNQSEQELIDLLKKTKQSILLTPEEKAELKVKLMSSVTRTPKLRYIMWIYKLNIKGVTMPLIPLILALLIAGGAGTAVLADSAKPGDLLYPVDQAVEYIQEKLPMSQSNRARLWAKISDERAQELLELRSVDPGEFDEKAQNIWEERQDRAIGRLAASIERVDAIQVKFQEKIEATDNESEITAFQQVITNLEAVEARRTIRIEEIEAKEFPGVENMPVLRRIQIWQETSPDERAAIRSSVAKKFMRRAPVVRTKIRNKIDSLLEDDDHDRDHEIDEDDDNDTEESHDSETSEDDDHDDDNDHDNQS